MFLEMDSTITQTYPMNFWQKYTQAPEIDGPFFTWLVLGILGYVYISKEPTATYQIQYITKYKQRNINILSKFKKLKLLNSFYFSETRCLHVYLQWHVSLENQKILLSCAFITNFFSFFLLLSPSPQESLVYLQIMKLHVHWNSCLPLEEWSLKIHHMKISGIQWQRLLKGDFQIFLTSQTANDNKAKISLGSDFNCCIQ